MKPHLKCIIRNNNRYYWCATLLNDKFVIIKVDIDYNIINETPMFRTHLELLEKKVRVIGTHDVDYNLPISTVALLQKSQ